MENINLTMSHLTEADACKKSRAFKAPMGGDEKAENYFRSVICKDTIKNALIYNIRDPKAVMQYMMTRFPECGFRNYQQMRQNLLWDHFRVMRYLKSEGRKPSFPREDTVDIGDRQYKVKVDVAFECGKQVNLVLFKIGKPTMTQTGRNNEFARDLQLYAMVLYGRKLGYENITASIYFLKKDTDQSRMAACDPTFFGGGNVVEITDIYNGVPNELDEKMAKKIAILKEGIEPEKQKEATCEMCEKYDLCKYALPPVRAEVTSASQNAANGKVKFSASQQEAIDHREGVARIIAGAGSGKTKTVVGHIQSLIEEGVKPSEICAMTFSKAAAGEMKARIEAGVGTEIPDLTVSTFNSFENDIVLENFESLGFSRKPKVIDDVEKYAIIADLLSKNPIYEWTGNSFLYFSTGRLGFRVRGALQVVADAFRACKKSKAENNGLVISGDIYSALSGDDIPGPAIDKLIGLYDQYEAMMLTKGLIEFDDQERLAFKVIESDPEYLKNRYAFRFLIVDEFQDTSAGQLQMIKYLMELPTYQSLMVVGDDLQAIYGFRDTTPEYIIHLDDYLGVPVKDIYLDDNYRSTGRICEYGNACIQLNRNRVPKELHAVREIGRPVVVNGFAKKKEEYQWIAKNIKMHLDDGMSPEDIAVIAYTKGELRSIADVLTKAGIPSFFGAPEPLMDNSRIRALLAFSRAVINPGSDKDVLIAANALQGGGLMDREDEEVSEKEAEVRLKVAEIRDEISPDRKKELFMQFLDDISYGDETLENFKERFETKDFDECIEYCRSFSMYGDGVEYRRTEKYPGVALVTAHSSKGLEWPVVFNTISNYTHAASNVEEIRRLLFVSATRARDELFISALWHAEKNKLNPYLREAFDNVGQLYSPQIDAI